VVITYFVVIRLANTKFCFYFSAPNAQAALCDWQDCLSKKQHFCIARGLFYTVVTVLFKNADTCFAGPASLTPAKVRGAHGHLVRTWGAEYLWVATLLQPGQPPRSLHRSYFHAKQGKWSTSLTSPHGPFQHNKAHLDLLRAGPSEVHEAGNFEVT